MPSEIPDQSGYVAPDRLYKRDAFLSAIGLGRHALRQARRAGIELKTLAVGKVLLVRGVDGIAFVERIAELQERTDH